MNSNKAIAIIPARGGSKRIPKKNIKLFIDKPMIQYSIDVALGSNLFDKVVVSTDSEEIANISLKCGAEVPFIRPKEFADDFTPLFKVVEHALNWSKQENLNYQYACCILATAPFIRTDDIKKGFEIIKEKKVSSVFSVTTYAFPIFRSLKINNKGQLEMFWPEYELTRSNDLPEAYHDAGQFYWIDIDIFLKTLKFYSKDSIPVILPRYIVQDIDTLEDWERAEIMYKIINNNKK